MLICFRQNLLRLAFPEREIVAARFDLHRITHRRKAHEFDLGAQSGERIEQYRLAAIGIAGQGDAGWVGTVFTVLIQRDDRLVATRELGKLDFLRCASLSLWQSSTVSSSNRTLRRRATGSTIQP